MTHLDEMPRKEAIQPLALAYYFIPFFLCALIGFFDSIYLAVSHYRVHSDMSYSSFCAVSRALNCDTVSSSPYAIFLNVPLAIWGILGYGVVVSILILALDSRLRTKRLWPTLFWLSFLYCIGSLILAWISSTLIHSYCIMCILSYLVNFSLLYYAWFVNRRFGNAGLLKGMIPDLKALWVLRKKTIPIIAGFLLVAAGLVAAMPAYWQTIPLKLDDSLATGVTEEGYPWIGAENPTLTIHEFSDYMCFQCKKMHFFLRELVQLYPDRIRLVHRHFPMDHLYNPLVADKFHSGTGKMAIIAIYASYREQFWRVNDFLFELAEQKKDFNTRTIADLMGVPSGELAAALKSKSIRLRLKHDIAVGIDLGVTGTPGFMIDGKVYTGTIPKEVLKKIKSFNG
jgi:uncharacterized membrane protein/protein-disulfide isomerase